VQLSGNFVKQIYLSNKSILIRRKTKQSSQTFSKTGIENKSARLSTSIQFSTVVSSIKKSSQSLIA
jgi:hypothetical protein